MRILRGLILVFWTVGMIRSAKSQDFSQYRIPCEKSVYLIHFYFVKDNKFKDQRNANELYLYTDSLNKLFKPSCIEFKICKIDTIQDYNYFNINNEFRTQEYLDIVKMYYNEFAINIYWVDNYSDLTINGICEPLGNRPFIFFEEGSISNLGAVQNFNIKMLRYFGMNFTESYWGSHELVNKSNGKITADSIWDTPADPDRSTFTSIDTFLGPLTLPYLYTNVKDANGEYYNPMIFNLLCNFLSREFRKNELTTGQYQQLVVRDRLCRKKRWGF